MTRLHDKYHPTPSPSSKPTKELLTPGGLHHEIGDEEGLVMMMAMNPPLRSPERTPDHPLDEEQEVAAALYHKTR